MRRAARRDANEKVIKEAAEKAGFRVYPTNELGDLFVQRGEGLRGEIWEVKAPKTGKLTPAQVRNRERGLQTRIVRTIDDVLKARKEWLT